MNIVEQIHQEFFTASDKITGFAVPEKAKRLYDLGFTASEDSKEFNPEREKLRELILEYQYLYPNNRFITDEEVERICKKYNLICGPVSAYTGKVPDSKLEQIASFQLDDYHKRPTLYEYQVTYHKTSAEWLVDKMEETKTEYKGLYICAPEKEMETEGLEKKGFFAMFQTKRHIEDPVVLHPCKGGWLILAAWGPEASDQDVVNHKMN